MKPECVYIEITREDGSVAIMHFVVRELAGRKARDYLTDEQIEAGFIEAAERQGAKTAKAKTALRKLFDAELDKHPVRRQCEPTDEAINAEIARAGITAKSWRRVDSPARPESMMKPREIPSSPRLVMNNA